MSIPSVPASVVQGADVLGKVELLADRITDVGCNMIMMAFRMLCEGSRSKPV